MSETQLQTLRDKIAGLDKRKAELNQRLRDAETKTQQRERKKDARRKIIVGALALEHMVANRESAFFRTLWPLLDEYVRPQDRALLNEYFESIGHPLLAPLPAPAANLDQAGAGPQTGKSLKQEFER